VSINAAGTGLQIDDANLPPLDLIVAEPAPTEFTATDLGIAGEVGASMVGADLSPRPEFVIAESGPGETTAADLGIVGNMNYAMVGSDLNPELLGTTELTALSNGHGWPQGMIKIAQGNSEFILDTADPGLVTVQDLIDQINSSGLTITAAINASRTGIEITNDDETQTLIIRNGDEQLAATAMGIAGSTDVVGNMMLLSEALRVDDEELVREMVGSLDQALDIVLNQRASVGAKMIRMEVTLNRLQDHEVNYTSLLSDVEDADVTKLVTDLAMQENAYTGALSAAAKIIQPSLLNFIR
jgi:flagellin-like hook-associated protein FlgL